jgi:hypothetical protein
MKTVEQEQDTLSGRVLPPGVRVALGELAGAAKEGLLALSVGVGLGVLSEMMEAELEEVVGPSTRGWWSARRCVMGTRMARLRWVADGCR